ncbi:hypothetical protein Scep_012001 [Stephania cephalantha]|uniref:Uncharacterized protein n=1 Tax=Stephania cephalantha TaxID=152367 RepID=A0AAP0P6D0_9MAGN
MFRQLLIKAALKVNLHATIWLSMSLFKLSSSTMETFIATWKEACNLHSSEEVFEMMLAF